MSTPTLPPATLLDRFRDELHAEVAKYHVITQVIRLISVFLVTLGTLMLGSGGHIDGGKALYSLGASAFWTSARQVWPTVSWPLVRDMLDQAIENGPLKLNVLLNSITRSKAEHPTAAGFSSTVTYPLQPAPLTNLSQDIPLNTTTAPRTDAVPITVSPAAAQAAAPPSRG